MRFPSGSALNCCGGGAAEAASSEKADGSLVAKVNLFYNGRSEILLIAVPARGIIFS